jgi:hypothetical protein
MVDETQPSVWTVYGTASKGPTKFTSIRLSLGTRAAAQIDELRVSDSWDAAVNIAKTQGKARRRPGCIAAFFPTVAWPSEAVRVCDDSITFIQKRVEAPFYGPRGVPGLQSPNVASWGAWLNPSPLATG